MPEKRGMKELHSQLSEQSLVFLCALHREKHNNHSSRDRKAQLNKLPCRETDPLQGSISPSEQNSRLLNVQDCASCLPSCHAAEEKIADAHHLFLGGWCVISTARTSPASCCWGLPASYITHSVPIWVTLWSCCSLVLDAAHALRSYCFQVCWQMLKSSDHSSILSTKNKKRFRYKAPF